MRVLIDADTLCYSAAAQAEHENAGLAKSNVDMGLGGLLRRLAEPEYELWITGDNNFRHTVYPEYKANRLKVPRPRFLKECRQHLVEMHGAHVSDGCEADDMLGIAQTTCCAAGQESMISSIDKDLLMIPGWHHVPELTRLGRTIREERRVYISESSGLQFFYTQLIVGDPTDNIKGIPGAGRVAAKTLLPPDEQFDESTALDRIRQAYGCDEELEMNALCLWIRRKPNENIVERWKELFGYES